VAPGFDVDFASTIRQRIAPDRIAFLFGPRHTPQEAIVTGTQMTRPPNQDSPNPANEQFPFVCGCPAASLMVQTARAGWTDPTDLRRPIVR
jgi:hypothetical protein